MPLPPRHGVSWIAWIAFGLFASAQPPKPEEQAKTVLAEARSAEASGDRSGASRRYDEVVQKFPNTLSAKHARYALARIAFHEPDADYAKVADAFAALHSAWDLPERAEAVYYTAASLRLVGLKELEKAAANPAVAERHEANARAKFEEARTRFESSRDALGKKDPEWEGRVRCDKAEMSIRLNKPKEARTTCEVFAKDSQYLKLKVRPLGLYYLGLACFLDGDTKSAGRYLNQLAPFNDPAFGLHARYLVGRILHLGGDRAEASVHYEAVVRDYGKAKLAAAEALGKPERLGNHPLEAARLKALATGPAPESVSGAEFHNACLSCDAGRYPEALEKFQAFAKAYPGDPLLPDAQLRIGFCQVQQKSNEDAIRTLQPLIGSSPRLADQAQFWLGKARFAAAMAFDPAKPRERNEALKQAVETLASALARTAQLAQQNDPDAKARKPEMQLELADSLFASGRSAEALPIYKQLWNERAIPQRAEELLQRYAAAMGASGEFDHSDELLGEFRKKYSQSALMPAVLYRHAENGYGKALAARKQNPTAAETRQKWESTAAKFMDVVEKYPEFERASHARMGAGICQLEADNAEAAATALEGIPAADRTGELALSAYLLADAYLRLAKTAVQENPIREKLSAAAQLLERFAAGPKAPETPAALMKLGTCYQRLGGRLADADERNRALNKAKAAFDRLIGEFPGDPLAGQAKLERVALRAVHGDPNGAIGEFKDLLRNEATRNDPSAPLAALHAATLLRRQNNPAEAAKLLAEARAKSEPALRNDPLRKDWVALLKYHHGLALLQSGKPLEARPIFEQVVSAAPGALVGAEAALRVGECLMVEGRKTLREGHAARAEAGRDTAKRSAAEETVRNGRLILAQASEGLLNQASAFKNALPNSEVRARMYYEAAWIHRELARDELAAAREAARKELSKTLAAKRPPGSPEPMVPLPEIDRSKVPPTRHEIRANDCYTRLIEDFPGLSLAVDARFELAEWRAERGEHAEAATLLKAALEAEPSDKPVPAETLERIRMRLGASLSETGEFKAAATQFEAVLANPESPHVVGCVYRAGECYLEAGEFGKAIAKFSMFRDRDGFRNHDGLGDRAMLRLGMAYLASKNADSAKEALETMLERFGESEFSPEARYALGQIALGQGRFDEAVVRFEQVVSSGKGQIAGKAKMQIGACRMAQKKFVEAAADFLGVRDRCDHPELANAALLEAATALARAGKTDEAEQLFRKLMDENPEDSTWSKAARKRLETVKTGG
jgi:TolA-binding protein